MRQLHRPAIGLPTQSTTQTKNSSSYSLACLPLRPTQSATSYLMMPPPLWGVEPRSFPGGSPSNLRASSIDATLISTEASAGAVTWYLTKEKKTKRKKKKILLLRFFFFSKSVVDDQTKIFKVRLCGSHQTSFSALTHTHILRFAAQPGIAHMHRERERDRNNGKNTECNLLGCLFRLSCGAGEQQCSLLPYARIHYMQAHTYMHTHSWQKVRTHRQWK